MTNLVISIINYKTKKLTEKCIKSILNKKWSINYEIWLIDNASNDGSIEFFKKNFPKVKLIISNKNLGFAGGHNLTLKKANTKYFLLLNSDTEVLDNSLDKMVEFMKENEVGIASCKVLGFDGKLQPSGGDLPVGFSLINWLFNLDVISAKLPTFHKFDPDYFSYIHETGWVSGNFMMIRKEVVEKVGFLNDDYFMYFEDVEYCFRAKKAGFKVMFNPEVSIKHLSGGSLDDPKFRQWSGEYKGLIIFYKQHFGNLLSFFVRFLILSATVLRILAFSILGKFQISKTYAKVITTI